MSASMSVQFWVWVAIILLSALSQARKRSKQAKPPVSSPPDQSPASTFDELLREIERRKAREFDPVFDEGTVRVPNSTEEVLVGEKEEGRLAEVPVKNYDDASTFRPVYSAEWSEIVEGQDTSEPSLAREDVRSREARVVGDSEKKSGRVPSLAMEDFHTRQGLRRAFIASEIFRRKF